MVATISLSAVFKQFVPSSQQRVPIGAVVGNYLKLPTVDRSSCEEIPPHPPCDISQVRSSLINLLSSSYFGQLCLRPLNTPSSSPCVPTVRGLATYGIGMNVPRGKPQGEKSTTRQGCSVAASGGLTRKQIAPQFQVQRKRQERSYKHRTMRTPALNSGPGSR